jgi:hypothetical protein
MLQAFAMDWMTPDLARQLARMRTDAYLLCVTPETLGVTLQLAKQLKLLNPGVTLLFWGMIEGSHPTLADLLGTLGQFLPFNAVENGLALLLPLCGLTGASAAAPLPSPYLSGLLPVADAVRLGLAVSDELHVLAQEIAWLSDQDLPKDAIVALHAQDVDETMLASICELLAKTKIATRFALHVSASTCSKAIFRVLPSVQVAQLVISGELSSLPPSAQEYRERIVAAENEESRVARAAIYGNNGNIALHTGFYFDAKQSPGIYHLTLPLSLTERDRESAYSWAGSNMDIRSAAVLTGSSTDINERLTGFAAPLSSETKGWPKHAYALGTDAGSNSAGMIFDGVTSTRQAMRYVSLSELDTVEARVGEVTFITMKTAQDADEMERRLGKFHTHGELSLPHPRTPLFLENSCRWMNYGACRLPLLRRLAIDDSMDLSSCRDAGTLGKLGDSYDQIVVRIKQYQQIEEVRRECATCAVRDQCSHCTQLPTEWNGRYCEIRKKHPQTSLYLEMFSFLPIIAPLLPNLQGDMIDLKVSYSGLPMQHYKGPTGAMPNGPRPLIVSMDKQHFAWWRGTRKLSRVSAPLAAMAEAWASGAEERDVAQALAQAFNVDLKEATSNLADGLNMLRTAGIIHV